MNIALNINKGGMFLMVVLHENKTTITNNSKRRFSMAERKIIGFL
jgi:hypothetical protein